MGRGLVVIGAALALLVPASPSAAAKAAVTCASGKTLFLQQGIRIFAVTRRAGYSFSGRSVVQYACRGRRGRPIRLGENFTDEGNQGDYSVENYAFSGSRHIGLSTDFTGGENCGASDFILRDLRSRRPLHSRENDCGFDSYEHESEAFAVTPSGGLAYVYAQKAWAYPPAAGSRRVQLSTRDPAIAPTDITARGELVYWTETSEGGAPVARSHALGTDVTGPESQVFANPRHPRRTGRCLRGGRTIARTVLVRVVERDGGRSACRVTRSSSVALPAGDLRDLQTAADRWVLALEAQRATIVDVKTGSARVIPLPAGADQWSLLDDGTLAWIESGGRLLAQAPAATTATVLAEAASGPSALASRGRTVYWTQAGGPHRATV